MATVPDTLQMLFYSLRYHVNIISFQLINFAETSCACPFIHWKIFIEHLGYISEQTEKHLCPLIKHGWSSDNKVEPKL